MKHYDNEKIKRLRQLFEVESLKYSCNLLNNFKRKRALRRMTRYARKIERLKRKEDKK